MLNVNEATVKKAFPVSNIEQCINTLKGNVFMSTLDMTPDYYQAPFDEKDEHKTAFITKYGLFL